MGADDGAPDGVRDHVGESDEFVSGAPTALGPPVGGAVRLALGFLVGFLVGGSVAPSPTLEAQPVYDWQEWPSPKAEAHSSSSPEGQGRRQCSKASIQLVPQYRLARTSSSEESSLRWGWLPDEGRRLART